MLLKQIYCPLNTLVIDFKPWQRSDVCVQYVLTMRQRTVLIGMER